MEAISLEIPPVKGVKTAPILIEKQKKFKALRPSQIVNMQRVIYDFEGRFLESFGQPERIAKWFITGRSFSGKSSMVFSLCHYLAQFSTLLYNNYEEKHAKTVGDKLIRHGLVDVEDRFRVLPGEPIEAFVSRMKGKGGAGIGIVDSVQHGRINKKVYDGLVNDLCNPRRGKGMIFINHWVKNDLTLHIRHDCDIKIEVIGFVAYVESRYGGNKPFLIWEEGAKKFWGVKKYKAVMSGDYWPGIKK